MRVRVWLAAVAMVGALAGCSSSAPDSPEGTLQELVKRIADGDGGKACELFLPGGKIAFAKSFEVADCPAAMDVVIGKVTDKKNYAAAKLKPSGKYPGVVVKGESAEFGGECSGWDGPDVASGDSPGDLGHFGLKKTDDGWLINDHRLSEGTCGG